MQEIGFRTATNRPTLWRVVLAAFIFLGAGLSAPGALRIPGIFSHHMVLQRDRPVPVWGWAATGSKVSVSFRGRTEAATADVDGFWRVELPAPEVSASPRTLEIRADTGESIVLRNVLVGDVWLCAGQSNMAWPIRHAEGAEEILGESERWGQIRVFRVPDSVAGEPSRELGSYWKVADPASLPDFSAVAYLFGREIHTTLYIPIGIVEAARGGTPIEAWTSREALETEPAARPILERWREVEEDWTPAFADTAYEQRRKRWRESVAEAETSGQRPPREPAPPVAPQENPARPAGLFNAMIHPVAPFAIRGIAWYQGEANVPRAAQYRHLLPLMIRDWRVRWDRDDLPFYLVQLPNFGRPGEDPGSPSPWAELQESQRLALALPRTGMAVTNDLGEAGNVHPRRKHEVAERLARWALHDEYGKRAVVPCGPLYASHRTEGTRVRIRFDFATGLRTRDDRPPGGFVISGADQIWHPAEASIDGETIVVWSPSVSSPSAVRYAWSGQPAGANLVNGAGLPASVFRTDDRPLWTEDQVEPSVDYSPPGRNPRGSP